MKVFLDNHQIQNNLQCLYFFPSPDVWYFPWWHVLVKCSSILFIIHSYVLTDGITTFKNALSIWRYIWKIKVWMIFNLLLIAFTTNNWKFEVPFLELAWPPCNGQTSDLRLVRCGFGKQIPPALLFQVICTSSQNFVVQSSTVHCFFLDIFESFHSVK